MKNPGRQSPAMIFGPRLLSCHEAGCACADRLEHPRRIEAARLRKRERLGRRLERERDRDLIGELGHLARARRAHIGDAFAEMIEERPRALEGDALAAHHNRERALDSAGLAAGDRRVEIIDAGAREARGDRALGVRRDRAHVDDELTRRSAGSICATTCFDVGRIGHHDEDDSAPSAASAAIGDDGGAVGGEARAFSGVRL